jgi:polyhydroxybutyrate depolymerase
LKIRRLRPSLLALVFVIALGGCGRATQANTPTDTIGGITVGGMQRTYLLHLPSSYQSSHPAPLLIALHGAGDTGGGMAELTGFDTLADAQGFLVAYPDAVERIWADRNNTYADQAGVDDVAFIGALIDRVAASYAVDPARVYVSGFSLGGLMTFLLGCTLSGTVAAVAAVAATMPVSVAQGCPSTRPEPLLLIHGEGDDVIPAAGGTLPGQDGHLGPTLSDADTAAFWAGRNGCTSPPGVTDLPATVNDGTRVRQTAYTGCRQNAEVVYDAVAGTGHVWPGGPQDPPTNLNASAAIWSFFASHPRQEIPMERPTGPR